MIKHPNGEDHDSLDPREVMLNGQRIVIRACSDCDSILIESDGGAVELINGCFEVLR